VGDTAVTRRSKMFPFLDEASCRGEDPELFYAESGAAITRAKSFCSTCDVRGSCLEWAINREEFGVWGGTTARERAAMRRERGVRLVSSGVA
jgi:WhiB family redox-sensing transcriptional regulator